jgi:hypothetical protein
MQTDQVTSVHIADEDRQLTRTEPRRASPWRAKRSSHDATAWVALVLGAALLGACSAGGPDDARTDESDLERVDQGSFDVDADQLLDAAMTLGFAADEVELLDDRVVIEGDMLVEPQTLLTMARLAREQQGVVEKGYFAPDVVRGASRQEPRVGIRAPRATSINLNFDASVSSDWINAFQQAAAQWNNGCINIQVGAGSHVIDVTVNPAIGADVLGRGEFARLVVQPGTRQSPEVVTVFPGTTLELTPVPQSAEDMLHIALHELGHNLGYAHPNEGALIPSTSVDTTSGDAVSYSTIMAPVLPSPPLPGLTTDDQRSRDLVFREITVSTPATDRSGQPGSIERCPNGTDIVQF